MPNPRAGTGTRRGPSRRPGAAGSPRYNGGIGLRNRRWSRPRRTKTSNPRAQKGLDPHVRERDGDPVSATQLAPDLRALGYVGADGRPPARRAAGRALRPSRPGATSPAPGPVGERHDADPVVGSEEDLGLEPRKGPLVLDDHVAAGVACKESQTDAREAGIGLVLGTGTWWPRWPARGPSRARWHRPRGAPGGSGSCPAGSRRRRRRRPSQPGARSPHEDRGRAGRSRWPVPGERARTDEIGVRHAERREDVLAQVPVQRLPAHVRHDLPGGRRPVVGVPEPGAGLDAEDQAPPVVLGERGTRRSIATLTPKSARSAARRGHLLVDPGGVGQEVAHRRRPPPAIPGNQLVRPRYSLAGRRGRRALVRRAAERRSR